MNKLYILIALFIASTLNAQALFEVKDASNNSVFEITNDGIRIFNFPDTLMIISSSEIRANLDNSKGLSRSFSVSTSATGKAGLTNVMEVTATDAMMHSLEVTGSNATMSSTAKGPHFSYFSPENLFLGLNAGQTTTGGNNVFVGNGSGNFNVGGANNVFVGRNAGYSNESGGSNVFIGYDAGYKNVAAGTNTYVGNSAGYFSTGIMNAFFGFGSGYSNTGNYNSFYGQNSGSMNSSGSDNCLFGFYAGYDSNGSNNTIMGSRAGHENETGSGNIFLGYQAGYNELGSNKLYIDNSNTTAPLIWGDFATNALTLNGDVHIINNTNDVAQKGLVIDTDGESTDIPLRIRTTSTASGWTDADTRFVVMGNGYVGIGTTSLSHKLEVQDDVVGPMARFKNLGNNYNRHGIRIDAGEYALGGDHWLIRCFTGDGSLYAGSIKSRDGVMSFDSPSDIRLKKNISTSNFNALKMLMELRIVDYQWKTSKDSDKYVTGYVAQEAQKVLPAMVSTNPDTGYLGISNSYLIPVLHKAIQEQQEYIEKLEYRLDQIEKLLSK